MAADPAPNVSLCADLLRGGFTTPERVTAFLADADASDLAAQLAERRGAMSFAGNLGEEVRARLTDLVAGALQLRLSDPDHLRTGPLASIEGAEEMVQIAVGVARRRLRTEPNYRPREPWESDGEPARRPAPAIFEVDPTTGRAMASERRAGPVEALPPHDTLACSRGAHAYGPVDPDSGWSRCLSCGYTLVVDRREGTLIPNSDGMVFRPALPPRPQGSLPWPL